MFASKSCALVLLLLLQSLPAMAAVEELGAHFRDPSEFRQVINNRCLNCHDRQRIEQALKRQEALEPLQRRMIEHGAILGERDREVLGTFWGSPLKPGK